MAPDPSALRDRDAIISYLEPLNPHAAVNLLQALILAGDGLTLFPYRGGFGLAAGTRELMAVWPYLIVYEVDADADADADLVRILRIWNGRRIGTSCDDRDEAMGSKPKPCMSALPRGKGGILLAEPFCLDIVSVWACEGAAALRRFQRRGWNNRGGNGGILIIVFAG